jgi:dienelactone hydrolase
MRLLVRYRNKEYTIVELEDDSYDPPQGQKGGFFTIGKSADDGHPVVVNLDEVVGLEPQARDSGPWIA